MWEMTSEDGIRLYCSRRWRDEGMRFLEMSERYQGESLLVRMEVAYLGSDESGILMSGEEERASLSSRSRFGMLNAEKDSVHKQDYIRLARAATPLAVVS